MYSTVVISIFTLLLLPHTIWFIVLNINSLRLQLQEKNNNNDSSVNLEKEKSKIAILLTVCDDFDTVVAKSALNQENVKFTLFILDDSKSQEVKNRIDKWTAEYKITKQIIRRNNNEGFKAGNINNWLYNHADLSVYHNVFIIDADVVLPSDYLFKLHSKLKDSGFVFVQGCQKQKKPSNWFEYAGGLLIDSEWLGFVAARKLWGLPQILGHGVLIKTDELLGVGGMPEIVSEDLALTIHFAERSKYGMICPEAVAEEQFPDTYKRYRNRLVRWIAADVEITGNYLKRIFRSKIKLSGKLDLLLRETRLPLLSLYSIILIILSLKLIFINSDTITASPYYIFLIPFIWISYLPSIWVNTTNLKQRIYFLLFMPFFSSSLLAEYPICFWKGIRKKVEFNPTNSIIQNRNSMPFWHIIYIIVYASILIIAGILAKSPIFIAIGLAILLSPVFSYMILNSSISMVFTFLFWALFFAQWLPLFNFGGMQVEALFALAGLTLCRD